MIQSNINDWIDDKKPNILYFCLEWYKKKPLKEAYWSYKKPDDMITYKKMYLKSLGNIYIVGKIENNNNEIKFGVKTISNTNLLISNLQKCIRQGHYDLAIQSSIHILANNPILLLRRLPIIMLEDTYPHISINTIIWMMVVYGNWFPKLYHIQWLLGVVKMMCLNPLNLKTFKKDTLEFNIRNNNDYIDNVFIDDISMVLSIILRSEYGGMQSDIKMLYWYVSYIINIYNANNTTNTSYSNIQISPVKLKLLNIKKEHILNESIDFHCYPNILNYVVKCTNSNYNEFYVKQVIWEYLSSKNYRDKNNKYPIESDCIILNYAKNYSKKILNSIFTSKSIDNNYEY